ncbi:MAG: O-antigen ligase family protein [Streptosporangiales bacterium]
MRAQGSTVDRADLPVWPVGLFFVGFPVWWMLGLAAFLIPLTAVPMAIVLLTRGRGIRLPAALLPWCVFLLLVLASAVMLDSLLRGVGFALRLGNYLGAAVALLYVYNARHRLPVGKVAALLTLFWLVVVAGGWLGVILPGGSLHTPVSVVLPDSLMSNEYVRDLVIPKFAEIRSPWGSPVVFARPSAPFPYTNAWGLNFALSTPFAVYTMVRHRRRFVRLTLAAALVASIVPAAATLNRGMFVALAFAGAYSAFRLALRGRLMALVALCAGAIVLIAGLQTLGFGEQLATRAQYSQSSEGRGALYAETFDATLRSPLLGYGAPRPSPNSSVSLGTQGQLWNVMFSHGFVALLAFELFFLAVLWRSRRAATAERLLPHVVVATALVTHIYYGLNGPELMTTMVAAGLALRLHTDHEPPEPAVEAFRPLAGAMR